MFFDYHVSMKLIDPNVIITTSYGRIDLYIRIKNSAKLGSWFSLIK